jgi:hypothetical protein
MFRKFLPVVVAAAVLASLGAAPAVAAEKSPAPREIDTVQQQIDRALAAEPGGVQTSKYTVEWNGGETIFTVPGGLSTMRAVGNCPDGRFCAFLGERYSGAKVESASCGTLNLGVIGNRPRSIANARDSGVVRAYDGSISRYAIGANVGIPTVTQQVTRLVCS